jgi:hypothetical protein
MPGELGTICGFLLRVGGEQGQSELGQRALEDGQGWAEQGRVSETGYGGPDGIVKMPYGQAFLRSLDR